MSIMKTDRILLTPKPLEEALKLLIGISEGYKNLPIATIKMIAIEAEQTTEPGESTAPPMIEYFTEITMGNIVDVNIEWDTT